MEIHVAEHDDSALRCAVCHDAVRHFKATCPGCNTLLHFSCRATLERCPTLGCGATWEASARPLRVHLRSRRASLGLAVRSWASSWVRGERDPLAGFRPRSRSPFGSRARSPFGSRARSPFGSRARTRCPGLLVVPLVLLAAGAFFASTLIPRFRQEPKAFKDLIALDRSVRLFHGDTGHYPERLSDLRGTYLPREPIDPWGNPYVFRHQAGGVYEILSYGADGVPGGTGDDQDIVLRRGFEDPPDTGRSLDLVASPPLLRSRSERPWEDSAEQPHGDPAFGGCELNGNR